MLASVPGSHPAVRRLQYESKRRKAFRTASNEKLDEIYHNSEAMTMSPGHFTSAEVNCSPSSQNHIVSNTHGGF